MTPAPQSLQFTVPSDGERLDRLLAAQEAVRELTRQGRLSRTQEMDAAVIDTRLRQLRQARREQTLQR